MSDPLSQLDQVNDVVQRAGFSDKRKRNEAIRMGLQSPGEFNSDFSSQIDEAQQPSDFLGAGRKLASNQNVDSGIMSLFSNNLQKSGDETFYYGPKDYSTLQFGTNGYSLKPKEGGLATYDIWDDKTNTSLGTSYGNLNEAMTSLGNRNRTNAINAMGPEGFVPEYDNFGNITNQDPTQGSVSIPNYGGELAQWEAFGQMLNNSSNGLGGYFPKDQYGVPYYEPTIQSHPHNNQGDLISGLNTLYNSTPLIDRANNSLLGYKMNLAPGDGANPFTSSYTKNGSKEKYDSQLWRELVDPEGWGKIGQKIGDKNDFFVSAENADKIPGWSNEDHWQYWRDKSPGGLSKTLGAISPILKMTPFAPMAYMIDFARGLESGNPMQGITSGLASMFMNMPGADFADMAGVDQMPSGGFSGADLVDYPSLSNGAFSGIDPNILKAGLGAGSALLNKQNPLVGLTSGLLGGAVNDGIHSLFNSDSDILNSALSKAGQGALNTGIKSLFNRNQEIHGGELQNRSGGLSALTNSENPTMMAQNDQDTSAQEQQQRLHRIFMVQQLGRQNGSQATATA